MVKIAVLLADGFEEIEALAIVDILRRLDFDVATVGIGSLRLTGAHNVRVEADINIEDIAIDSNFDAVVLPGGMPGAENLKNNKYVLNLLKAMNSEGKIIAAICAAPIVLEEAGLISGKTVTCYPSFEKCFTNSNYTAKNCEVDGNIITSKGPGTAFEFACKIAESLGKSQEAKNLMKGMFITF